MGPHGERAPLEAVLWIADGGAATFTRIQKWGNGQGIRLSRELLAQAGMDVGDAVDVSLHDGTLVLVPARRVRGGHDLRALVSQMPADYRQEELEWDPPAGREVW